MKEFFKAFLSFGLATSIEKIVSFILLPFYTSYFSPADYGVMDLLQVVIGITAVFAVLQLETSLQRYYYDFDDHEKGSLIFTIFFIVFIASILITLLIVLFSHEISYLLFQSYEYQSLLQIVSLQIPSINISMLCFLLLRYEKRNKDFLISILIKVVSFLFLIYLNLVILDKGIKGVLYAQLLSSLIVVMFLFYKIKELIVLEFSRLLLNKSLKYSLPQFPARLGSVMLSYSNRFFMVGVLSVSAIGIFSLSLKFASLIQLVYTAFVMAWAPFMFGKRNDENHKVIFSNVLNLMSTVVFFLVSLIPLFARDIFKYIIATDFIEAAQYVGPLCLSFSLLIFKEIVDIGPKYMEKTKYLSYTFLFSVFINVLSLWILVPRYGVTGVVCSLILTNTVLLALSWIVSNRLYPINFNYYKFILFALPAYSISFVSLFVQFDLLVIMSLVLLLTVVYGYYFKLYLMKFRKLSDV